jgi:hypothetical protein
LFSHAEKVVLYGSYTWTTLVHKLHVIAVDYESKGSIFSIDVFFAEPLRIRAATKEGWAAGPLTDWKDFSQWHLGVHDCPGGHYTMIDADNVGDFAVTLNRVLEGRGLCDVHVLFHKHDFDAVPSGLDPK